MHVRSVRLSNFRNYPRLEVQLHPKLNLLIGPNARGKTSVLESLYCLSTTRSFRATADEEVIAFDSDSASVEGEFEQGDSAERLRIEFRRGRGKALYIDGKKQARLSTALGRLPAVIFSPDDLFLVKGGPVLRRRFLNTALLQMEPAYLADLQQYERALRQRNALLRAANRPSDPEIAAWDEPLVRYGTSLTSRRAEAVARLAAHAGGALKDLTGGGERLELGYAPSVPDAGEGKSAQDAFREALQRRRAEERIRGATLTGPHRDDLVLSVNGKPLKKFGSQGQQRTAALALKLAELALLTEATGKAPLILFDDVMSELDAERQAFFLKRLLSGGQAVLTGTEASDFSAALDSARRFEVDAGRVVMGTEGPSS